MPETYAGIVVPLFQGRLAGVNHGGLPRTVLRWKPSG
jgi:hypothetical protein